MVRRNKKTKKITSTTKNLEHMTAKRERERGGGIVTLFPSPGSAPALSRKRVKKKKNISRKAESLDLRVLSRGPIFQVSKVETEMKQPLKTFIS